MENFGIVRMEHLNHHGYLFGGEMLKWVDEYAWIAATRDYPGCSLVTIAMDQVEFRKRVVNGSLLRFAIRWVKQSTSAVTYAVDVYARKTNEAAEQQVFSTRVTYVHIDEAGHKRPLPPRIHVER